MSKLAVSKQVCTMREDVKENGFLPTVILGPLASSGTKVSAGVESTHSTPAIQRQVLSLPRPSAPLCVRQEVGLNNENGSPDYSPELKWIKKKY